MSYLKKYAWYGSAVVASALLAVALLLAGPADKASAATLTTAGDITVPLATNVATGTDTGTAGTIVLTLDAADMQTGETLILTAPGTFVFAAAPTSELSGPATTLTGVGTAVLSGANQVATFTATANNNAAAVMTISFSVIPADIQEATGDIAMTGTGVAAIADVATLTVDSSAGGWVSVAPIADVPADGSSSTTVTAIVGTGTAGAALPQTSKSATFSASLGGFGTTGTTSTTTFTNAASGVATATYRGTGTAGSDTVVVSTPSPNSAVGTETATITGAAAGVPAALTHVSTTPAYVAASNSTATYISPTLSSNVIFKVADAAGTGVNDQILQISTDKGALVPGASQACAGATAKTVVANTAGAGALAGRATVTYCPSATAANLGTSTITASNVSTTMASASTTLTAAGPPADVATAVTGNSVAATVTDADGNMVANGTVVRFTLPSTQGALSVTCTTTVGGMASTSAALTEDSGNVLVSVEAGDPAATCAASGPVVASTVATVGTSTTPPPPPADGEGTFDRPIPNTGVNTAVWNGGTVSQLSAAVAAAGGISVTVFVDGQATVLIPGAPAFVNAAFNAAFPTGEVPSGTIVLVVR